MSTTVVVFYEKPGCATNARQRRLLETAGHRVVARSVLAEAWTADRLREFFHDMPVTEWFNPAAPRIKSGEVDPRGLTPELALSLMLADPLLIRRPLLQIGDVRIAGFDPQRLQAHLVVAHLSSSREASAAAQEACSRLPQTHRPRY